MPFSLTFRPVHSRFINIYLCSISIWLLSLYTISSSNLCSRLSEIVSVLFLIYNIISYFFCHLLPPLLFYLTPWRHGPPVIERTRYVYIFPCLFLLRIIRLTLITIHSQEVRCFKRSSSFYTFFISTYPLCLPISQQSLSTVRAVNVLTTIWTQFTRT